MSNVRTLQEALLIFLINKKNKWREKFQAKNQIRVLENNVWKEKKPRCLPGDGKRSYTTANTGRFIFKTSKGTRIKYLGVGFK